MFLVKLHTFISPEAGADVAVGRVLALSWDTTGPAGWLLPFNNTMERASKQSIIDKFRKSGRRYEVCFGWFAKGENKCKGFKCNFEWFSGNKKGILLVYFDGIFAHTWTGDFLG